MRNLKQALSLTLASIMLLGMMVVGANAKGYSNVDDSHNVEAIEVLTRNDVAQLVLNTLKNSMVEPDNGNKVSVTVGDAQVSVGASNYVYVTSSEDYTAAINDVRLNNASATTGLNARVVELGEKLYQGDLNLFPNQRDAFGRPAVRWTYKTNEIGVYVDYPSVYKSWTAKVSKSELYSLLGSGNASRLDLIDPDDFEPDVHTDKLLVYVDGEALDPTTAYAVKDIMGVTAKNYVDRDNTGASGDKIGAGKGVLTEVFQDILTRLDADDPFDNHADVFVGGWYDYSKNSSGEYTLVKAKTSSGFTLVGSPTFNVDNGRVRIGNDSVNSPIGNSSTICVVYQGNNNLLYVLNESTHDRNVDRDTGDTVYTFNSILIKDGEAKKTTVQITQNWNTSGAGHFDCVYTAFTSYGIDSDGYYELDKANDQIVDGDDVSKTIATAKEITCDGYTFTWGKNEFVANAKSINNIVLVVYPKAINGATSPDVALLKAEVQMDEDASNKTFEKYSGRQIENKSGALDTVVEVEAPELADGNTIEDGALTATVGDASGATLTAAIERDDAGDTANWE